MSDWNLVENSMRSWTPRAPSPKVRARLFPQVIPATEGPTGLWWACLTRGLAPVAAAAMVCLMAISPRESELLPLHGGNSASFAMAALSNQFYAAYIPASLHSRFNASPETRFGWTNEHGFRSSTRFFPQLGTNHLLW